MIQTNKEWEANGLSHKSKNLGPTLPILGSKLLKLWRDICSGSQCKKLKSQYRSTIKVFVYKILIKPHSYHVRIW